MARLNKSEYEAYAPATAGSVRVNHHSPSCKGDSKSMKVCREEDGRVWAKCYRCGGYGSYTEGLSKYSSVAKTKFTKKTKEVKHLTLPSDSVQDLYKFPVQARADYNKYNITQADIITYGIVYSAYFDRVIIPVYIEGELEGWQGRYYGSDTTQPKYITRYKTSGDLFQILKARGKLFEGCVVVEDMLSAIRCAKWADTVALLGNHMSDKCFDLATNVFDNYLIFLDNDNRQVKLKQVELYDRLTSVGMHVNIFTSDGKDPKEYQDPSLLGILGKYLPRS